LADHLFDLAAERLVGPLVAVEEPLEDPLLLPRHGRTRLACVDEAADLGDRIDQGDRGLWANRSHWGLR